MSYRNCLSIISVIALLAQPGHCHAQDNRLERIGLQYRLFTASPGTPTAALVAQVSNAFLNEGDTYRALRVAKQLDSGDGVYFFLKGKALFIDDAYSESLSELSKVDPSTLSDDFRKELRFFRVLDHIHLLHPDSAAAEMTTFQLKTGGDTTGIKRVFQSTPPPRHYDLKKASRHSWIPGGGLFYVNEPRMAWGSILLQGIFAGYTGYSVYTKHYVTAALTGVSQFMRFYGGGRRSAVNAASRKNRKNYLQYVLTLDHFAEKIFFGIEK
jgi:hypothetical protein